MCLVEVARAGRAGRAAKAADTLSVYDLAAPFRNHHLVMRSYGSNSLVALVNTKKFIVEDVHVRGISTNNIAMFVDLMHKRADTPMTLVVTHFPANHPGRYDILKTFGARVRERVVGARPLLICGDFNMEGTLARESIEEHTGTCVRIPPVSDTIPGTFLGFREIDRAYRVPDTAREFDVVAVRDLETDRHAIADLTQHTYGDTIATYTYPSDHLAVHLRAFLTVRV
jgi:hypothetical protein